MSHRCTVFALSGLVGFVFCSATLGASVPNSEVQAIFDRNCIKCHGPLEHKSGLELDTTEAALQGNRDGAVIVPGKPAESKIIAVLSPDSDPHMPPKKQLAGADIAKLRGWIAGLPANATNADPASSAGTGKRVKPLELAKVPSEPSAAIDYILAASWKRDGVHPTPVC